MNPLVPKLLLVVVFFIALEGTLVRVQRQEALRTSLRTSGCSAVFLHILASHCISSTLSGTALPLVEAVTVHFPVCAWEEARSTQS